MRMLAGTLGLIALVGATWWVDRQPPTQPIIVEIFNDVTPSRSRFPEVEKANRQSCQKLAEHGSDKDQSVVAIFSDRSQIISEKTITNRLSSLQRCKTLQLPDEQRQIDFSRGTHLTVPLQQAPILAEQLRQRSGEENKPALVVILMDSNDGELNSEHEWQTKAAAIDEMTRKNMVFVALVGDAKLHSHLNQYVRNDRFQTCPLADATTCLEWGIRTARSL